MNLIIFVVNLRINSLEYLPKYSIIKKSYFVLFRFLFILKFKKSLKIDRLIYNYIQK